MSNSLAIGMKADAEIAFFDQAGNPTSKPGPVNWTSTSPEVASVASKPDDTEAVITAKALGSTTIAAASGAISDTISVTVIAGAAASGTITIGPSYPGSKR